MGADVKGDAYEGLLEKNAQDMPPRALFRSAAARPRAGDRAP
jgi:hypothetical protein